MPFLNMKNTTRTIFHTLFDITGRLLSIFNFGIIWERESDYERDGDWERDIWRDVFDLRTRGRRVMRLYIVGEKGKDENEIWILIESTIYVLLYVFIIFCYISFLILTLLGEASLCMLLAGEDKRSDLLLTLLSWIEIVEIKHIHQASQKIMPDCVSSNACILQNAI
jgi:hypothetical protein